MLLTFILFVFMGLVIFGVVLLATRPTANENATERRLKQLLGPAGMIEPAAAKSDSGTKKSGPFRDYLESKSYARYLQKLILQSHVKTSVPVILQVILVLAVLGFLPVWHFLGSIPMAIFAALIGGCLPVMYLQYRRKKWLAAFNAALPECIATCARALRAGHSIIAAIGIIAQDCAAPANAEFSEVFKQQRYGLPLRDALMQMIERVPSMDLKIMVTALLVQRDTGGNLADLLDRLVGVIRDRLRIQRDVRAYTAQGRMTGWVLVLLPAVLMVALNLISPGYSSAFIHDPLGKHLLYISVGLLFCGVLIIRQIINGIEA